MKLTIIQILGALVAFSILHDVCAGPTEDQTFANAIIGTWLVMAGPESTPYGETTYSPDGLLKGYNTITYKYQSGRERRVRVQMIGHWKIKDGVLMITNLQSVPEGIVPMINSVQYLIQSINSTEAYFEKQSSGKKIYRRRKYGG